MWQRKSGKVQTGTDSLSKYLLAEEMQTDSCLHPPRYRTIKLYFSSTLEEFIFHQIQHSQPTWTAEPRTNANGENFPCRKGKRKSARKLSLLTFSNLTHLFLLFCLFFVCVQNQRQSDPQTGCRLRCVCVCVCVCVKVWLPCAELMATDLSPESGRAMSHFLGRNHMHLRFPISLSSLCTNSFPPRDDERYLSPDRTSHSNAVHLLFSFHPPSSRLLFVAVLVFDTLVALVAQPHPDVRWGLQGGQI